MDTPLAVAALVMAIGFLGLAHTMSQLGRRQARLEAKLDRILTHLDVPAPDPGRLDRVRALAADGRTVEAIRQHRRQTGSDLREAKAAVDRMSEGS